jgi:hypothetical protein
MPPALGTIAVGALLHDKAHNAVTFRAPLLANVHGRILDANQSAKQQTTT